MARCSGRPRDGRALRPGDRSLDRNSEAAGAGHDLFLVHALAGWDGADGGCQLGRLESRRRTVRPDHRVLGESRAHALRPRYGHAAPRWHGARGGWLLRHWCPEFSPSCTSLPACRCQPRWLPCRHRHRPRSRPRPRSRRRSRRRTRPRPVLFRRTLGPGRSPSSTRAQDPGRCSWPRTARTASAQLCGSVTPNVVPAGMTKNVTFMLPPKTVKTCWLWLDPVPGQGGSMFQTSDAPLAGKILFQEGEGGAQGGGWVSP